MTGYHHYLVEHGFEPSDESAGARVFTQGQMTRFPEEFTMAGYVANRAVEFLGSSPAEPWMAQIHFHEPHPRYSSPYDDWHDPESIQVRPAFRRMPPDNAAWTNRARPRRQTKRR